MLCTVNYARSNKKSSQTHFYWLRDILLKHREQDPKFPPPPNPQGRPLLKGDKTAPKTFSLTKDTNIRKSDKIILERSHKLVPIGWRLHMLKWFMLKDEMAVKCFGSQDVSTTIHRCFEIPFTPITLQGQHVMLASWNHSRSWNVWRICLLAVHI